MASAEGIVGHGAIEKGKIRQGFGLMWQGISEWATAISWEKMLGIPPIEEYPSIQLSNTELRERFPQFYSAMMQIVEKYNGRE